jgi:hypothetical protein
MVKCEAQKSKVANILGRREYVKVSPFIFFYHGTKKTHGIDRYS